ncbi:Eukaryotic translation initiation factor 3 subunit D [Araneus ventricosus]|uniref:Eukaryotic translation initiation factor 3 subunit p66 n=1 Tax=Araneus ventricosus TaxID=182803 RepID=A0A4Y2R267_ARAVE|nr:Eukaryotic translation initiation factor 3 subunit D [Araneus ventricosus]
MTESSSTESDYHFNIPNIQDNPTGWGPCSLPEQFQDMPYQQFSKNDRLGKVADWTGNTYQDRRYANKRNKFHTVILSFTLLKVGSLPIF